MEMINGVGEAGWRLFTYAHVTSTNDIARDLPAWTAVRADSQRSGRGRFGRPFISGRGGLWLSAVLPAPGDMSKWAGFSLMVGCHLIRMLEGLAVPEARLRWPNDLMAGKKKLGGLLIEQPFPETLIVGLGLNICNRPWQVVPELEETSTSLACVLPEAPDLQDMTVRVLDALANAHKMMEEHGMNGAIKEFNDRWTVPVPVKLVLSRGEHVSGHFTGLDPLGNLCVINGSNSKNIIEHHTVQKLIELI